MPSTLLLEFVIHMKNCSLHAQFYDQCQTSNVNKMITE